MMRGIAPLIICLALYFGESSAHRRQGKHKRKDRCVLTIDSEDRANGTLTSPSYPHSYKQNIQCHYIFKGKPDERVQLVFTDFNLAVTQQIKENPCEGADRLDIFLVSSQHRNKINRFCGNRVPEGQMSSDSSLRLELHTFSRPYRVRPRGFKAVYKFVKNFGIETGEQNIRSDCKFIFRSSGMSHGIFKSPNHPGFYPRNTECLYIFYARPNEKVAITFPYFDVDGMPPCDAATASDFVEFSNFPTMDRGLVLACGDEWPRNILSDGSYFRIRFRSNDEFDATGFMAYYQFRNASEVSCRRLHISSQASTNTFSTSKGVIFLSVFGSKLWWIFKS